MRGGPQKPKYKLPKDPNVSFTHIVYVGANKYVFETKEEAEAFHYFLKNGIPIDLALQEVTRLKESGELTKDEPGGGGTGGFSQY